MGIDPISIPDLCAKNNVKPTDDPDNPDNPNVVVGELDTVLYIVVSLWEQERSHLTYLDLIVDKLQESLKFRVQDENFCQGLHERKAARSNND